MSKLNEEEKRARKKARQIAYRAKNREREKARAAAYYIANKKKIDARIKAHDATHKEERKSRWKIWYAANRERIIKRDRAYRAIDPGRQETYARKKLLKEYNITLEDYERIFKAQDGRCKLCGKRSKKRMLDVDHNHETSEVRELLCRRCNMGLGYFGDDPNLLLKAALYIEEHN